MILINHFQNTAASRFGLKCSLLFCFMIMSSAQLVMAGDTVDYPKLKDGEWEFTATPENLPPGLPPGIFGAMKSIMCVDANSQDKLITNSGQNSNCEKPKITVSGNTYTSELNCEIAGEKTKSHVVTTFSGDNAFTSKISTGGGKVPAMTLVSKGRHVGNCKDGRGPGDLVVLGPNGQPMFKSNVGR